MTPLERAQAALARLEAAEQQAAQQPEPPPPADPISEALGDLLHDQAARLSRITGRPS